MAIILDTPRTLTPQATGDPTLDELKTLKQNWLQMAQDSGNLDDLRLIVRTLGNPAEIPGWPTWKAYELRRGEIRAQYFEGWGAWLPTHEAYDRILVLVVYVDSLRVCYVRESDSRQPADNFIVPGQWVNRLLTELERAESVFYARCASLVESERAALASQLLIGLAV